MRSPGRTRLYFELIGLFPAAVAVVAGVTAPEILKEWLFLREHLHLPFAVVVLILGLVAWRFITTVVPRTRSCIRKRSGKLVLLELLLLMGTLVAYGANKIAVDAFQYSVIIDAVQVALTSSSVAMLTAAWAVLVGVLVALLRLPSCFISYSGQDREFAGKLAKILSKKGFRFWFAPEAMHGGEKVDEQLREGIWAYDKLLLILSRHSMASNWVLYEIQEALHREQKEGCRILFPIRLVDLDAVKAWSGEIGSYHIPDFSNWRIDHLFEADVDQLVADLNA